MQNATVIVEHLKINSEQAKWIQVNTEPICACIPSYLYASSVCSVHFPCMIVSWI